MTTLREAAQQALEALEWVYGGAPVPRDGAAAIRAIRAALAEPDYWQEEARRYAGNADYWRNKYEALAETVQEPVAWVNKERNTITWDKLYPDMNALYTAPPQRKALTEDEIALIVADCSASAHRHDDFSFARAIERAHGIGGQAMNRETCEHLVPIDLRCDHCEDTDPYDTLGETYALNMQLSVQRKTIDALKAAQEHDTVLLRQALEALRIANQHGWLFADHEDALTSAIVALRERLGDKT